MSELTRKLTQCVFPPLDEPYNRALREAVRYILERYDDAVGIIAAGSILRGQGRATSDLDLYVIRTRPQRQRVQRWFNGVPAEIFVNPPHQVEQYFADEFRDSRPITAHMLANGALVLALDPVVARLRAQAETELARAPVPPEADLRWERYIAALELEDALDILDENPAGGAMILGGAAHKMLRYAFRQAGRPIPRDKDLLAALESLDPALADLARRFYLAHEPDAQRALAEQIADRTLGVRGFFEWESDPETV